MTIVESQLNSTVMYAKVFSQIFDGTLCTKGPWEALVTFQQLLVLADQDGNVDMTASAISRRTTIPLEIIEKGIACLLLEDPESRTPTENGRRIIPLSEGRAWGWRVVNYTHYRSLKREDDRRAYHREYWQKRKLKHSTETQHTQPAQPIAEAEAKAEAINTKPPAAEPPGFGAFWKAWPSSDRKQAKGKCLDVWKRAKAETALEQILSHVERMKQSQGWTKQAGEYIPAPLVYLNNRSWEGAEDTQDSRPSVLLGAI